MNTFSLIRLNIKAVLLMVGTMITLPFAHMAGQEALSNWAMNVEGMYHRLNEEYRKLKFKD